MSTIETEPVQPAKAPTNIPLILMLITSIGFILMLVVMAFVNVPDKNAGLLNTLIGTLGAAFLMIVGFYFGSSASSQKKDDTISKIAQSP